MFVWGCFSAGLVFGAFGEASSSGGVLVKALGDCIGKQNMDLMGCVSVKPAAAIATWQARRTIAIVHWRDSANLLGSMLHHTIDGRMRVRNPSNFHSRRLCGQSFMDYKQKSMRVAM